MEGAAMSRVDISDATGVPLRLCVPCGQAHAEKIGARWPEPHEHSAVTRFGRDRVTIRVVKDVEPDCEWCASVEREPERDRDEDDGQTYADPRDEREERLKDW